MIAPAMSPSALIQRDHSGKKEPWRLLHASDPYADFPLGEFPAQIQGWNVESPIFEQVISAVRPRFIGGGRQLEGREFDLLTRVVTASLTTTSPPSYSLPAVDMSIHRLPYPRTARAPSPKERSMLHTPGVIGSC